MAIIDYVVIGIIALFLVIGLIRGMVKMTFGLVSGLAALVIAVMLCTTVAGVVVDKTDWDTKLATALQSTIVIGGTETIVYDESNPAEDVLGYYSTNEETGAREFHPIDDLFNSNIALKLLSGPIKAAIANSYTRDIAAVKQQTLPNLIAGWAAVVILQVISFILLWIALSILLRIICILLKKFVGATFIGHFLDRALGGIAGVAVAWLLIMLVFTVIGIMKDLSFMKPVMDHLNTSIVAKFLYDNNFIYNLLSAKIDFSAIIGGLNSLGGIGA